MNQTNIRTKQILESRSAEWLGRPIVIQSMSFRIFSLEYHGDVDITHIIDETDDGERIRIEDKRRELIFSG